ncbi:hypothetical protein CAEBREN_16841 [Caenorhabditis brenneri]|uniref:Uncharacterized protein n=1 Tax=Caenorhabditis brenneri TaxID=135651 RepID=G0MT92_CAEBE|nr:hypothetical protein CAEBREN_16841 [Caenorhabditis brenneri]
MIYINWYHENLPTMLGIFSFLINPMFIYLVLTETKSQVGSYKNLLIMFSVFDILYSISEIFVPLGITGNEYGFIVFVSGGIFFEDPELGQYAMANRCGFISISYALLIIHFVYRYLALFHPYKLTYFFKPIGILLLTSLIIFHAASWALICQTCLAADDEVRSILSKSFRKQYGEDSQNIGMLAALYWVYMKIQKITFEQTLSATSIRLQRQLFFTLTMQTGIPILGSFLPTVVSWYAPILGWDIGWWNTNVPTVALAAFPCIDPLVYILIVPNYRNALLGRSNVSTGQNTVGNFGNVVPPNNIVFFITRVRPQN